MLLFYGSWQFSDRIDKQTLSLGTSYLRYWLPIYILAMPMLATLIWQITKLIPKLKYRQYYQVIIAAMLIFILFMPTINLVYRRTDESLFLLKNLSANRIKSQIINQKTNPQDIIVIYKQADKIFFPERSNIIAELVVPADYQAVGRLAKLRDIYYYIYAPPGIARSISIRYFEPLGLKLVEGQKVLGADWIYKIQKINPE